MANLKRIPKTREELPPQKQVEMQSTKCWAQQKFDSDYADKDLAWWIELARDFRRATKVPLPDDDEEHEL